MIEGMDRDRLCAFVAAMWEKQGWTTKTTTRDEDRLVVVNRTDPEPERGLILVVADPEGTIGTKRLAAFHEFCVENDAGEAAVVTTGSVAPGAVAPAEQRGIGLLDGDDLREIVRTHGLEELADEYGGSPGTDSPVDRVRSAVLAALPDDFDADGIVAKVKASVSDLSDRLDDAEAVANAKDTAQKLSANAPVSGRAVVAVVTVLAIVVAGVLVGPSLPVIPFLDGGGEAAIPVSAQSLAPSNSDGVLLVSWDAERRSVIDPDPDDEAAYYPRENRTFLVVEYKLTNAGGSAVPVSSEGFLVEDNGTVRGHQPLAGTTGFEGRDLVPGDVLTGWLAFSIDPDSSNLVVTADQNAFGPGDVTVQFSEDPELAVASNVTA